MPDILIMIFLVIGMLSTLVHENVKDNATSRHLVTISVFFYGLALCGIWMNLSGG